MTTDTFTDRLSEYVDDEISREERRAIEAHLETCADCREVLSEIRSVVAPAGALEDTAPANDLWPAVAARVSAERPRRAGVALFKRILSSRRFSFTLPQLAAASLAVMLLSGGVVWLARS